MCTSLGNHDVWNFKRVPTGVIEKKKRLSFLYLQTSLFKAFPITNEVHEVRLLNLNPCQISVFRSNLSSWK